MDSWFKLDRNYCRLLKRWDISINTLWVLEHLQRHPEGGEPAVLADQVNMLRQTMTLTLDQLEKRGYLCRTPHKTDRRRKIVTLTPPGQAFAAEVLDVVTGFELAAMEGADRRRTRSAGRELREVSGSVRKEPRKRK